MSLKKVTLTLCILTFSFSTFQAKTNKILSLDKDLFPKKLEYYSPNDSVVLQLCELIDSINIGAQKKTFNGSVLVGYKGKVIYSNSYGMADKEEKQFNTLDISTQLASITKTFTGSAILKLYEQGLIDIDQPVKNYIPEFFYPTITVEHLLSHRSGLPDYLGFSKNYWKTNEPMYNEDVLNMFVEGQFGLNFTPGTRFKYCNSNYALLGIIIERVTVKPFKEFMDEEIFTPLHLNKTYVFDPSDKQPVPSAKSYKKNFAIWKNNYQDGVYGDKGIFSTVEDLFKWDLALKSDDFISEETLENAYTPRSPWYVRKNYGLGWRIKTYPDQEKYVYHTGWWHGYQGIFSRYIKDDFTVIILSNRFINGITANSELIYKSCQPILELTPLNG